MIAHGQVICFVRIFYIFKFLPQNLIMCIFGLTPSVPSSFTIPKMYESYSKKKNHERSSHFKVAKTNNTELAPNMLTCYVFIKVFTVTQVCCCTSDFNISAVKGLESLHRRVGPVKGGNKNL